MTGLMQRRYRAMILGLALTTGCGSQTPSEPTATAPDAAPAVASSTPEAVAPSSSTASAGSSADAAPAPLPRISLGSQSNNGGTAGGQAASGHDDAVGFTRDDVLAAMKPMQILRDEWNAVRQRSVGGQDAGEKQVWIWDFRTRPKQPALVMESPDGAYFRHARLTYTPSEHQFELTLTDADDRERVFAGDFSQPVEEVELGDNKVHRTYKLQLTEASPPEGENPWQIVLNQQENNRYLMEMYRKRGNAFQRFETISAQRQGTSFALSDTDYGDKTCVISGGLGTTQVSYQGKSYWVCCSGCQAAFQEDPARWIAEFEAKQKAAKE